MTSSIFEYTNRSSHGKDNYRIKSRQDINKQLLCSCSGCDKNRDSLSIYCHYHRERYRRYGHPTLTVPTQAELRALEDVIRNWLEGEYLKTEFIKKSFKLSWGTALNQLKKNPKYAVPYYTLEGCSGYTTQTKGFIILSWYQHKRGKPLGAAMLRYMAVRLWAECNFKLPQGKRNYSKELNYFVNTWAGKFVLAHSGFNKTKTENKIIGWEDNSYLASFEPSQRLEPITERVTKKVRLPQNKAASITRAIGVELKAALDHAIGTHWVSNSSLLVQANNALLNLSV